MEENKNIEVNTEEVPMILRMTDERVNIRTSNSLGKLLPSLVEFHKNLDSIDKSSENPFFKSSYATIDTILEHIKPVLAKQGLCLMQMIIDGGENHLCIKTLLLHESGEFIETDSVPFPIDKRNIQSTMSSISYIRRYTINAICNLAFKDEDDDGNSVQGTKPAETKKAQTTQTTQTQATESSDTPRRRRSV